jgi:hypothetical protein
MAVRLSGLSAGRPLPPGRFLVLISVRGWVDPQGHSAAGRNFLYLVCEAIGPAATPGLLCQSRVIVKMIVEKQIECRLAGETEVFGENLPQRHFCPSQNPTWPDPVMNPGRRGGKPATNRLRAGRIRSIDKIQWAHRESNPRTFGL